MSKKNARYWSERKMNQNILKDKELAREVNKRMQLLRDDIQKQINAELERYAKRENISTVEARMRADKMDVEAFQRKAKDYVQRKDFSDRANYELKLYNLKMRMSRLELLKADIGLEMISTFDELDKFLKKELSIEGYKELEFQAGILGETIFGDYKKIVEAVVNGTFKNASFSERIWSYQTELKLELEKLITKQLVGGHNPRVIARELRKSFDVSESQAYRLIKTESARIQTELQEQSFKEYSVKKYEFISEPTACSICKALDGSIHDVSKLEPGKNASPMHPNCRCDLAPISDREIKDLQY